MGFSFSTKKAQETSAPSPKELQLTKGEVEAMLTMIKASNFKGEQVEDVFNLVLKLQEYYIALKD
jgi:hypothetical protein